MIISFEDISVQNVTCFRCIRAPDVTPYPARGQKEFYIKTAIRPNIYFEQDVLNFNDCPQSAKAQLTNVSVDPSVCSHISL
jgi:hypothetical protein